MNNYLFILLGAIAFFAVLYWDITTDIKKWKQERTVKHKKEAWQRIALLIPAMALLTFFHPGVLIWSALCTKLMGFFVYWMLFDGFYNKGRGKDWWYLGSIDADESALDNFIRTIGQTAHKVLKISGALIFTGIYIYTLFK